MGSTYCSLQNWSNVPSCSEALEKFVQTHLLREIISSPNADPDNQISLGASAAMPHLNIAALSQSLLLQIFAGWQMKVTFNVLEYQCFLRCLVGPV